LSLNSVAVGHTHAKASLGSLYVFISEKAMSSSSVLTSAGVRRWIQRLFVTAARVHLQASSSRASSRRQQSTNVDEDDQFVVIDSEKLDAAVRRQQGDHIDRHVRSSGKHQATPTAMTSPRQKLTMNPIMTICIALC